MKVTIPNILTCQDLPQGSLIWQQYISIIYGYLWLWFPSVSWSWQSSVHFVIFELKQRSRLLFLSKLFKGVSKLYFFPFEAGLGVIFLNFFYLLLLISQDFTLCFWTVIDKKEEWKTVYFFLCFALIMIVTNLTASLHIAFLWIT